MEYFGTDLSDCGHYTWNLDGDRMVKIGLLPKNTPFNPEELTNNLSRGESIYYQSSKFTVLGIAGSCKDDRNGTKSIFWVRKLVTKNEMIEIIRENKLSKRIIDAMPFPIYF